MLVDYLDGVLKHRGNKLIFGVVEAMCSHARHNLHPRPLLVVILSRHHVHGFPSSGTFVVSRFEKNSRIILAPILPAIPMAALVKTSFAPRSARG